MGTDKESGIDSYLGIELPDYFQILEERADGADEPSPVRRGGTERPERAPEPASPQGGTPAGQRPAAGRHQAPEPRAEARRQAPAEPRTEARRQTPPEPRTEARRQTPPEPRTEVRRREQAPRQSGEHRPGTSPRPQARRPAPPPRPVKRRTYEQVRRSRRITALVVFLLLAVAGLLASQITVFRVKDFAVASASVDQQVLSWRQSRGVDAYRIYDGEGTLLAEVEADAEPQYAVSGLQSGQSYSYSIVAVKNFLGKHSSRAVTCSAYTLLSPVSAMAVTCSGSGAVLNWEDSGASGYEVQYTDATGETRTLETQNSGDEGLSIPSLMEGNQYTFQLRRYEQNGEERIYSGWTSAQPLTAVHTVDMTGVNIMKPMVALTFDDGPDYEDVTDRILGALSQYGGHATFFQLGDRAEKMPSLMTRIADAGNEIACHTYDHTHYGADVTADDIIRANDAIEKACGRRPSAFRSPGGETTDLICQTCASEGIPVVAWSLDTADWQSRDADAICDVVMNKVSDGDIILMHNIYHPTADAVERIVPYLVDNGYQLVTVSQLVQAKTGSPPVPGRQYHTATVTR